MAVTYQPIPASGSPTYAPIIIDVTLAASAKVIHTASSTSIDELWIDAFNTGLNAELLYVIIGANSPQNIITIPIPPQRGLIPLFKGVRFSSGIVISAYASTPNTVSVLANTINRLVVS